MSPKAENPDLSIELLSQVLDTNATGIIIIDENTNVVFWNQWIEETSLIKKEQACNKNLFTLFSDLKNSRIHKAIDLSFSKGNASFISHAFNKKTFPLYNNGDKKKPLQQTLHIKRVKLDNNKRYCFIQIHDSTTTVYREQQLRKLAREAQALSQLKSGFVSSVSHELRTPLTSIMGALGLLKAGIEQPDSKNFKSMLEIAYNNADRLLLLINDILDIEKIESGKMEYNFTKVNIDELLRYCISQNTGLSKKYNISFNYTKNSSLPFVHADQDRIFQVLNNLMSNAAKFEPRNGVIEIAAALIDNKVRVSITDHGPGIPIDFQDKVFLTFTQADVSNTKKIGGTGLGLAISKKIIEHHSGEIGFNSKLEKGSCFYFSLPASKE